MQKIVTNLWFDGRVEEAIEFYTSVFPNANVLHISYYGDENPDKKGEVLVANLELEGQAFTIINGGPLYQLNPAMSLLVNCDTQAEIDHLWEKLIEGGGQHIQCGWLTDRFGVSWQIVPAVLEQMMQSDDKVKIQRMMNAMLAMHKLDIAALERAYHGE